MNWMSRNKMFGIISNMRNQGTIFVLVTKYLEPHFTTVEEPSQLYQGNTLQGNQRVFFANEAALGKFIPLKIWLVN